MPRLSVITPCYNLGIYLQEAIESVDALSGVSWEHIIIDDCSPQQETADIIDALRQSNQNPARKILRNEVNLELAGTLNRGISMATGDYIIVLSADDALIPEAVARCAQWLDAHPEEHIAYGDAVMFGAENGLDKSRPFNLQLMLLNNFIHASAVYRKEVWSATGGYDTTMPFIAIEDWEFWIHASKLGFRFHYMDEPVFRYRILESSKNRTINTDKGKVNAMLDHLYNRHEGFTGAALLDAFLIERLRSNPLAFFYKWMLKAYFPARFEKLWQKGKLRKFH